MIPLLVAFQEERDALGYTIIDMITNAMFALNILLTFFTAFYDDEHNLITSHKVRIEFLRKSLGHCTTLCVIMALVRYGFSCAFGSDG